MVAGSNKNEREEKYQHGIDHQGRMEKKNKTLGTEICANIDTLYINKYILDSIKISHYIFYFVLMWHDFASSTMEKFANGDIYSISVSVRK